jgi:DNA-binding NtrC family response regulator
VTSILVVGSDVALLEGVAQTLVGAGHQVVIAKDIPEALETLHDDRPLVALVHCDELLSRGAMLRPALAEGGAMVAFHCDDADEQRLPFRVKRSTLAELTLPLERQRLLALVRHVETRAQAAGRGSGGGESAEEEIRPG